MATPAPDPGTPGTPEVHSAAEALLVCRAGRPPGSPVDLQRVADLLGRDGPAAARQALGDLVVDDPAHDGAPVAVEDYCSGDVRARLVEATAAARDDERYRRNVDLLTDVLPPRVGPLEIAVSLGAPWIDPEDVEQFVHEVLGGRARVWHLASAAHWTVVPLGKVPAGRYGTGRLSSYEILAHGLNGRRPIVVDRVPGPRPGHRVPVRNVEESLAAQDRLTALQTRFAQWVWEDAERTERLVEEYNRRFTSWVPRTPDGAQLTTPGLADGVALWPWQRDVVARALTGPATLCAHAVGAGKTRSMALLAMTARRLGLARRPLVAVPAHLVEQTAREFRQAYPLGRFLVAGEDGAGSRHQLAARWSSGDWDAVIVSHAQFGALPVAPEIERQWLLDQVTAAQAEIAAGRGGRYGRTVLRRRIASLQTRLERLAGAPRPQVTLDTLGVDLVLVDEAHYFKRLPIVSRREGVSLGSSQRAADLLLKARLLRARRGRLPSLVLFTGTPWSNTVAETFVWQTLLQPDRLADAGIDVFDAWAATFLDFEELVEVTPDSSGFRMKHRPSRIRNLPELRAMLADVVEVLPRDALGDGDVPERVDDMVVCAPSPGQRAYLGSLALRADKIRRSRSRGGRGEDNMLALCTDGRRAALDPVLVGVAEDSPKIAAIADRVRLLHRREPDALQIVFCDQGTPGRDGPQTYGRLRRALAARGIPAERIRWVHEATTPAERVALFAACRDGAVSVLLGSTDTLGTGANVQTRLRALHHADAPWRPSDVEQREGRALRPGNSHPVVDIVRYVTRGTFDGYMWQTLERKARFVEQLQRGMRDAGTTRVLDDIGDAVLTYAEVKALATGNPMLLELARVEAEVGRLRVLRSLATQQVTAARRARDAAEQRRRDLTRQLGQLRAAAQRIAEAGPVTDDEAGVREAVAAAVARVRDGDTSPTPQRGPWTGLGVELLPAGARERLTVRITLAHRPVDELTVPAAAFARGHVPAAERAVVTALRRWRRRVDERITGVEQAAGAAAATAARAEAVIEGFRFDRAADLADAETRLAMIRTALEAAVDELESDELDAGRDGAA